MYQVWKVFERATTAKYYVININTKKVQSSWSNYLDAKMTCEALNKAA